MKTNITQLTIVDVQNLIQWKKYVAMVRRIILEGVQEHIVSKIHGKETPFTTWKKITEIFENIYDSRKMTLKNKVRKINMEKNDSILNFLTKFTQICDELGEVGVTIAKDDMVRLDLLSLPKS